VASVRARLGAVMLSLGVAAGCHPMPYKQGPAGPPPSDGGRERRIAALMSIYAHAREAVEGPDRSETAFRAMPVVDAARVLRESTTPIGEIRRRRAIAKLAAADLARPEFRDAIAVLLGGEDPQNPYSDPQLMMLTIHVVIDAHPQAGLFAREALLSNLLAWLFGRIPGVYAYRDLTTTVQCSPVVSLTLCPPQSTPCDPCDPTYVYHPNDPCDPCNRPVPFLGPYPTTATTTVQILRPVGEIAPLFDGQSWAECGDFFDQTYAAQPTSPPMPVGNSPTPGSNWQGTLYESFHLTTANFALAQFENLLDVTSTSTTAPEAYRFTYGLHQTVSSKLAMLPTLIQIQKDCGYLSATASGPWTSIRNKKTIGFNSSALDSSTCLLLSAMGDAVVELASCIPPTP